MATAELESSSSRCLGPMHVNAGLRREAFDPFSEQGWCVDFFGWARAPSGSPASEGFHSVQGRQRRSHVSGRCPSVLGVARGCLRHNLVQRGGHGRVAEGGQRHTFDDSALGHVED